MELQKIIVLSSIFIFLLLTIVFAIVYSRRYKASIKNSQSDVSDKKLIEYINNQPDKIVDFKIVMKEFGLTKFEAKGRLGHFLSNGLLKTMTTRNGLKRYFSLIKPIDKSYDLELTDDPFMTVEDLILIFKHNDFQVTLQEICLCTGLPIKVILEEMKYFEKENVVKCLLSSNNGGFTHQKVYILSEPYRSNPEKFVGLKNVNFELKEIYENAKRV